jgi:hypothetical protein
MQIPEYLQDCVAEILAYEFHTANNLRTVSEQKMRPSFLLHPSIFPDGNKWCALLGNDLQEGVAAFGDTPDEAYRNFDIAWLTQRCGLEASHE